MWLLGTKLPFLQYLLLKLLWSVRTAARSLVSSWSQEVEVGRCCCAAPGCPGSAGTRVVWGVYDWLPCSLAPCFLARSSCWPHMASQALSRENFMSFKVTSLAVLGVVSRQTLLALKNLLTLTGPFLFLLACQKVPEPSSGHYMRYCQGYTFPCSDRQHWLVPFCLTKKKEKVLSSAGGGSACKLAQPSQRAVWQGISEVLTVSTFSPRIFNSGNFVVRKLEGDVFRN